MSDDPTTWPLLEDWLEDALYDPDRGFYETGGRAGRRGASFVTAPETGPLFGAVLARALDRWWADAGRPETWTVVDAGAGPGTLARAVSAAAPECATALRYVCVERTAAQRARHPDGVTSLAELPAAADVIIANELLDNLAFGAVARTDEGWLPVRVGPDGRTHPATDSGWVPVAAHAAAWVLDARQRAPRVGVFDYADDTAALAARPWRDWIRAFAEHGRLDEPFADPGSRDVTVVVAHDQLPTPTAHRSQADWLRAHGIDELVAEGQAYWEAHAARPDLTAMAMRSRGTEAASLLDPDGLGGFRVLEWVAPTA